MGIGNRPVAWLVLGLVGLGLVGAILLQTVTPPAPPAAAPAPAPSAASPTAAPTAAASSAPSGGPSTTINATEKDFAIALDNSSVPAGSVTFKVKNNGPSPHDIGVKELNKATDIIDPGKSGELTVDLKAGTYTVICTIPGHEQLGMHVTLTVK
jgi:plastocyanin